MGGKYAIMVFVNVMWGLSFVVSKHAMNSGFSPMMLALVRYAIATACLVPVMLKEGGGVKLRRRDVLPMTLSGLTGITVYYWCEYNGIQRTSTVDASLILAAIPIITMVVEAIVDRRRMRPVQITGAAASLAGVGLIVAGGAEGASSMTGNLLILGAAAVWVMYIFLSRRLRKHYSSVAMNTWQAATALVTLIPLAIGDPCDLTAIPWDGWAAAAVLAVICSALCYVLYGNALSAMTPLASAIFINLIPLSTIVGGVLMLGEHITWLNAAGGVLIIGSILLVTAGERRAE